MSIKKKIIIGIITLFLLIIAIIGIAYGFFMTRVIGNSSNTVVLESGESEITVEYFETEDEYHYITPGYTHYKMFTVKNTGDVGVAYEIFLENVVNEFVRTSDVTYTLYKKPYEGTVTANSNIFDYNNLSNCVAEPLEIPENYPSTCYLVSTNTFPTQKSSIANKEVIQTSNYKYVYLLKYEYINSQENQDIDKGHIFSGKVKVYGKNAAEAVSPFDEGTLASKIVENAINSLNGTIYSETPLTTPAQSISRQKYEKNNNLIEYKTQSNITTSNVFTYASDYTEDTTTGKFTLTTPTNDTFTNIYSSLPGKYIVSYTGAASAASTENINAIYKVISTTSNSISYAEVSKYASDEKTLSKIEENGGVSYYFRGGVENNYINFNNMCWRIVRIDSTGGIKLVLASQDGECSNENLTYNSGYIKLNGTVTTKNFGYKARTLLTPTGTNKSVNVEDFINSTSGAKKGIEDWFTANNFDTTKLKQNDWCLGNLDDAYNNSGVKYELTNEMLDGNGDQYASARDYLLATGTTFYYKTRTRISGYGQTINASLNCNDITDTKYSSYVGLLTVDEVSLAGGKYSDTSYTFYLHDNALSNYWWTASHSYFLGNNDVAFGVDPAGGVYYHNVGDSFALRPAVVLKSGTIYISGDGTIESPYTIETE